jgi:iron complex transport system ATP-binding protein
MDLLAASNLSCSYGDHVALKNVSLFLNQSQILTLIGPNGSGKSTLIKSLLGHVQCTGAVTWKGKPLASWSRRELSRLVAYLPQTPGSEPGQTVLDVLRLGRTPYWGAFGLESSADEKVLTDVAETLGLTALLNRPIEQLSGGQRQRVFIGRCLAQEPAALLLDEPNTFLDLKHQIDLCQVLRRLATDKRLAIILASHELNIAGAFSDSMILMHEGSIAAAGTPGEILRPEVLSPVYGIPLQRFGPAGNPVISPQLPSEISK